MLQSSAPCLCCNCLVFIALIWSFAIYVARIERCEEMRRRRDVSICTLTMSDENFLLRLYWKWDYLISIYNYFIASKFITWNENWLTKSLNFVFIFHIIFWICFIYLSFFLNCFYNFSYISIISDDDYDFLLNMRI